MNRRAFLAASLAGPTALAMPSSSAPEPQATLQLAQGVDPRAFVSVRGRIFAVYADGIRDGTELVRALLDAGQIIPGGTYRITSAVRL